MTRVNTMEMITIKIIKRHSNTTMEMVRRIKRSRQFPEFLND
jgi:hypothetical protein